MRRKEEEKERERLFEGALKKFNAKDIEGVRQNQFTCPSRCRWGTLAPTSPST